jgi:alkylhydroperoxidase family enzyme
MSRIEPLPLDELPEEALALIREGQAGGYINSTLFLQVLAHSPEALLMRLRDIKARWHFGRVDPRLQELLRLRCAHMLGCDPCSASRKEASVSEDDIACVIQPMPAGLTPGELAAVKLLDAIALDHFSVGDELYAELAEHYSAAEVVELGEYIGWMVGGQRWAHTVDVSGTSAPVVRAQEVAFPRQ